MFEKIIRSKTKSFNSAALLVALSTFLSGFLGLWRDRLFASRFGAGHTLDVYFSAFRIPDLITAVLVAGGIGAVFMPIFSEEIKKSREKAFAFTNNLLHTSFIVLFCACLFFVFFTPCFLKIVAPGFSGPHFQETVWLTRILFLGPIIFGASAVFSGLLQYFDSYFVYSLAPVLYNLGIIIGIVVFFPLLDPFGWGIYGLGMGVVLGALAHFLIQIPAAKAAGYYYQKVINFKNYRLDRALNLMRHSASGAFFIQVNLIVVTALSSFLIPGSIAIFNLTNNLQGFPIALIGMPFAVAIFPILSRNWAYQQKQALKQNFFLGARQIIFLITPISAGIFLLRAQIVRIVLGAGVWGWQETRLASASLGIFSLSVLGASLVFFLRKAFYAVQETKLPTIIEAGVLASEVVLSLFFLSVFSPGSSRALFFSQLLRLEGIADIRLIAFPLAISISLCFQAFLLFYLFIRKTKIGLLEGFVSFISKVCLLCFLMSLTVWLCLRLAIFILAINTFAAVFFQFSLAAAAGALVYLGGAWLIGFSEIKGLRVVLKRFSRQKKETFSLPLEEKKEGL